jgi:hypothetical protein
MAPDHYETKIPYTMAKKKPKKKKPGVHDELEGFEIRINEFGEIISNFEVDRINEFLNENVEDKKLREKQEKETGGDEEE